MPPRALSQISVALATIAVIVCMAPVVRAVAALLPLGDADLTAPVTKALYALGRHAAVVFGMLSAFSLVKAQYDGPAGRGRPPGR